ncbi:hypothetical protein FGO68_gene14994 [Halteria grandinella]|uniref:Uncharacterized protein n=1 Tax=Halteria grandinella TaxID=5974 RepID=A0A8J8NXR6_HALGN|nr:hypothetical protein FGO68_gene14994 [Halteria grandinella]
MNFRRHRLERVFADSSGASVIWQGYRGLRCYNRSFIEDSNDIIIQQFRNNSQNANSRRLLELSSLPRALQRCSRVLSLPYFTLRSMPKGTQESCLPQLSG